MIPQNQFLHSQNFRSDLIEYVWRFDDLDFVVQINKNADIYMECVSPRTGRYKSGFIPSFFQNCNGKRLDDVLSNQSLWTFGSFPTVYNNFQNGKDLIPLITDSLNFLIKD